MKKGLLLSVVASGFIFAGGNIAPAAPVAAPAAAPAACDFYGSIAARYEANSNAAGKKLFNKKANKLFVGVDLGIDTQLGNGFGLGLEAAAIKGFDKVGEASPAETAELSQAYLTYKTGNTAIKAGRQALPKSLSPWAWTDNTLGRLATTFEGVVLVNTDVKDTTLVGAWIAKAGSGSSFGNVNGKNAKGLFAVAAQNKSVANTTLTGTLYYITEMKAKSVWLSAETKAGSVDLGLQGAYAKASGATKSYAISAYAKTSLNGLGLKLVATHLDNGATPLNLAGTSGVWGVGMGLVKGVESAGKRNLILLGANYGLPSGKIYSNVGYETKTKNIGARVGYKFKVAGVNAKVEYRYRKDKASGKKDQRVRVQGVYKF